ncbi:MAG TPA: hypothetical protein VMI74_07270 [Burkholderiales bacterium]|nr:hypothetical protein [Burkholderiales bacterium]
MRAWLSRCRLFALAFMLSFSIANARAQSPPPELYVIALATVATMSQQPIPSLPEALRGNSLYWRVLRSANTVNYQLCLGFFDARSDAERARQQLATNFREARVFSVNPVERDNLLKAQQAARLAPPAPPAESISPALPPPAAADLNPAATPAPPAPNDQPSVVPSAAARRTSLDLRVKLGGAAGIDHVEVTNIVTADATQDAGGNFQIELVMAQRPESGVGLVGSVGLFGRQHNGKVPDPVLPTDIKYAAAGVSGSIGASFRANENLNFEGRLELGIGSGVPTLTTPGFAWNSVRAGLYSSASLIFGSYYTITSPGLQIGLELGAQSFVGNFQIWNNTGFWSDAKVSGSGGMGNLIVGYRF